MRTLLALTTLLFALPAWAITPEDLEAKVQQIAQYRVDRIGLKPPEISAADRRKAASAVHTGIDSATGAIYGVGVLNVPIARLWSALNDETRQYQYTAVTYSELIAGTPCQPGRKILQVLDVPIPFAPDKWWIGLPNPNLKIMRNSGGSVRELAFSSSVDMNLLANASGKAYAVNGSPIGYSKGAWFLVAVDARSTYVEYHAYSDPGGGVRGGFASRLAAGAIKDNFEAMAKFATQGNPSCPIQ